MILTELTSVSAAQLPIVLLREHLRLGTGFADEGHQDALLEAYLRAAIAAVEGRTGCVLLNKGMSWGLTAWRDLDRQVLPVRPVSAIDAVTLVDMAGAVTVVDPQGYRLVRDDQAPLLVANTGCLPVIGKNGSVEIVFQAGFGADWSTVPPDLARAAILLAAEFYESRATQDATSLPAGVLALLERFRPIRLFGGV